MTWVRTALLAAGGYRPANRQRVVSAALRLVAETTARTGTLVRIIVEGPLSDPDVVFSSTPDLPQDEVLAQLVFGVSLASITPFQAVQLASEPAAGAALAD